MRAVVQVASQASVVVNGQSVAELPGPGLVVLLGVSILDSEEDATLIAQKLYGLRILEEESSAETTGAPILVISQFTLYGEVRKGRRPSWIKAARPEQAEPLYEFFVQQLRHLGAEVQTGVFGAMMDVTLTNSGPFTVIIDSADLKGPRRPVS